MKRLNSFAWIYKGMEIKHLNYSAIDMTAQNFMKANVLDSIPKTVKTVDIIPNVFKEFLENVKNHPAFSGVITVAWGDADPMTIITANSHEQSPILDAATSFNIMSVGKAFTAIAVMQLVEDNKLSLDTPLSEIRLEDSDYMLLNADQKYRDDLNPNSQFEKEVNESIAKFREDNRITVGHLLRHQAGLLDDMNFKGLRFDRDKVDEAHYSNYGYQLLARIIEKVSDEKSFPEYMNRHIFLPSGAHASVNLEGQEPTPHVCVGGELMKTGAHSVQVPSADGNGCWWMTSGSLMRVIQSFTRGDLCKQSSIEILINPVGDGDFVRPACGMNTAPDENKPAIFFQGTFEGRSAVAFAVTGGEKPLFVSGVFNSIDGSNFWADMVRIYRGEKVDKPLEGANFTNRVKLSKELYDFLSMDPPKEKEEMKKVLLSYARHKDLASDFLPISYKLEDEGFLEAAALMREADAELRQGIM